MADPNDPFNFRAFRNYRPVTGYRPTTGFGFGGMPGDTAAGAGIGTGRIPAGGAVSFPGSTDAFSGVLPSTRADGGSFAATDYGSLANFGGGGGAAPSRRGPGFDQARAQGLGFGTGDDVTDLMPKLNSWQKAGIGMQGLSSLANAYMGMKQFGLAKDQFNFQKAAYEANYQNQMRDQNRLLEERQRRRMLERPETTVPVEEYMARFGAR